MEQGRGGRLIRREEGTEGRREGIVDWKEGRQRGRERGKKEWIVGGRMVGTKEGRKEANNERMMDGGNEGALINYLV